MAEIYRQHRQTATYMWNKCTIVYHTLWAQKESCPRFCYKLLWKAPHCSKSICKISASFKIKKYPGNSYCNRSNPRTTSTSTVNNNNNNNAVNKVFKFYTVSHIHNFQERKYNYLNKKLYETIRQGISQAYHHMILFAQKHFFIIFYQARYCKSLW